MRAPLMRAAVRFFPGRTALPRGRGFTLIEMIVVIAIAGIVASMLLLFFMKPFQEYVDMGRRAALVDTAESALRRMARDLRIALPNSVRVTNSPNGFALELLPIIDGGKYTTTGITFAKINLHGNFDMDFNNLGCFQNITPGVYSNYHIVVNNLGTAGFDAYGPLTYNKQGNTTGIITPAMTITITNNAGASCQTDGIGVGDQHIHFGANHAFLDSSPRNRFYVVEKPVSYICDEATDTLTRYADYPAQTSQPTADALKAAALNPLIGPLAGVTSALVADSIDACSITSTSVDTRNRSLVTLDLALAKEGETIRLIHQVQQDNSR